MTENRISSENSAGYVPLPLHAGGRRGNKDGVGYKNTHERSVDAGQKAGKTTPPPNDPPQERK
ncbi:hypothetical protein [Franconibacter pulveris]|uniref:hypothetical protein n=1 Tax=Franconibacter pulveris TaxID=435910 RepID=UPI000495DC5D|nr:hypothetical protein [Franconibacter pulveris]HBI08830.1 hypothetical protein [Franconibacter pulveris]